MDEDDALADLGPLSLGRGHEVVVVEGLALVQRLLAAVAGDIDEDPPPTTPRSAIGRMLAFFRPPVVVSAGYPL